jgi:hypothetical protein
VNTQQFIKFNSEQTISIYPSWLLNVLSFPGNLSLSGDLYLKAIEANNVSFTILANITGYILTK